MSLLDDIEVQMARGDIDVPKEAFKNRVSMFVNRIIHPVGQGAFYSEKIHINNQSFNIVYDCGSNTSYKVNGKKKVVQTEVRSYYHKEETINLLFISHFDNDHVNGLEYLKDHCNIKCVIMPLLTPSAKWFYLSQLDENLQQLITDPQVFFGEGTKIIRVKYTNGEKTERDELVLNNNEPIHKNEIVSGTIIQFRNLQDWCYIPFNFDEESRYEKLIDALKGSSLDTDALLQGDIDYIKEHRTAINNAYKKVVKSRNSNDSSLIVYSGPTYTGHSFYRKYNFKFGYCRTSPRLSLKEVACLYLGDTNLNQKSEKMNLCHALSYHLNNVKENIGLIQVPHHGSKHNFNDDILFISEGACAYFASFGRRNHFGHPSYRVVEDIEMHGSFVGITEDRDSAFIDVIYKR